MYKLSGVELQAKRTIEEFAKNKTQLKYIRTLGYDLYDFAQEIPEGKLHINNIEEFEPRFQRAVYPIATLETEIKGIADQVKDWASPAMTLGYNSKITGKNPGLWEIEEAFWSWLTYDDPTKPDLNPSIFVQPLHKIDWDPEVPEWEKPFATLFGVFIRSVEEGIEFALYEEYLVRKKKNIEEGKQDSESLKSALSRSIRLKWNGNKNQLYDLLRQLQKGKYIGNSLEDIAAFIKLNFTGFDEVSLSTIQTEMKRAGRPTPTKRLVDDLPQIEEKEK